MKIIDELNEYFGTEEETISKFEANFTLNHYSHDYVESLINFMEHLDKKLNQ